MITFKTVTDLKIKSAILEQITVFNLKSYSSKEMDMMIQNFKALHGEDAVNELVNFYEQYVLGSDKGFC